MAPPYSCLPMNALTTKQPQRTVMSVLDRA
jgi:hypothetical protein